MFRILAISMVLTAAVLVQTSDVYGQYYAPAPVVVYRPTPVVTYSPAPVVGYSPVTAVAPPVVTYRPVYPTVYQTRAFFRPWVTRTVIGYSPAPVVRTYRPVWGW